MENIFEYKCPACGGALEFNSAIQKMKCPYCDTEVAVEELQARDEALNNIQPDSFEWKENATNSWSEGETEGMSVFTCKSCGGEIVGDENTGATSCPYCGNPVVITGSFTGKLKPDFIIPFKLDKNAAKKKYQEHLKGKKFLPDLFKSENHIDEIKGLYVPFWLFDSDIQAFADFQATRVRRWSDSNYDYTETSFFDVIRDGNMSFTNVPVDGSEKMDDELMQSIEPFDFSEAVPFQTAYMAGYLADKYDEDDKKSVEKANARIKESAIAVLEDTFRHHYTTVIPNPTRSSVQLKKGVVKYAMYPVWILTSTYKNKKYTFAMNGQTGKFVGNLPADSGKMWRTFAGLTAVFTVIATIATYFILG
jgi:DNA-directed RNA polymerase subunit RPC12/RpoP